MAGEFSQFRRYVLEHDNVLPFGVARVTISQTTSGAFDKVTVEDPFKIIPYIRDHSHRYLAKHTANTNGIAVATICQLNDRNSAQFWDGTTADLSTGAMGDVFMKIDFPVYFRFPNGNNPDQLIAEITLRPTTGFNVRWWPNWMIGVFEGYVTSSKMYSLAGKSVSNNFTQANGLSYATAKGVGYTIDVWVMHTLMGWFYYSLYANTNCQTSIGYGDTKRDSTVAYKQTGQTVNLGMIDTVGERGIILPSYQLGATNQGNNMSINFWGIENWWGNFSEWFSDAKALTAGSANLTVWVPDPDTGLLSANCQTREIPVAVCMKQNNSTSFSSCFVERMLGGDYGDLVNAKATISGTEMTQDTGWCDTQAHTNIDSSTWAGNQTRVVYRSVSLAHPSGGVAYASANSAASATHTSVGGRLAFSGTIAEATSVAEFISAQQI